MRGVAQDATCPRCEHRMPPTGHRLLTCAECGLSFQPKERQERVRRRHADDEAPAGIRVVRADGVLTLRFPASVVVGGMLLVFAGGFAAVPIATGIMGLWLFMGPFALVMIFVAAVAFSPLEIRVDAREVTIGHRPISAGRVQRIPRAQITDFGLDAYETRHGKRYAVVVTLGDGATRSITVHHDLALAQDVLELLRDAIRDVPRAG